MDGDPPPPPAPAACGADGPPLNASASPRKRSSPEPSPPADTKRPRLSPAADPPADPPEATPDPPEATPDPPEATPDPPSDSPRKKKRMDKTAHADAPTTPTNENSQKQVRRQERRAAARARMEAAKLKALEKGNALGDATTGRDDVFAPQSSSAVEDSDSVFDSDVERSATSEEEADEDKDTLVQRALQARDQKLNGNNNVDKKKNKQPKLTRKMREAQKMAQVDLARGGQFAELANGQDASLNSASSSDGDLQINLEQWSEQEQELEQRPEQDSEHDSDGYEPPEDMPMGDTEALPDQQQESPAPINGKQNGLPMGRTDVFLHPSEAFWQRTYYSGYRPPPYEHEESRPMFGRVSGPISAQRNWIAEGMQAPLSEAERVCNCCGLRGHSQEQCPDLTCSHCGAHDEHFSETCPSAPTPSSPPPPYDWHPIPASRHIADAPLRPLKPACYSCSASTHYGDDCPHARTPPSSRPPSAFSIAAIVRDGYASADWVAQYNVQAHSSGYGRAAKSNPASFNPFAEYLRTAPPPSRRARQEAPRGVHQWFDRGARGGGGGGGGGGGQSYRPSSSRRDPIPLPQRGAWDPPPPPHRGRGAAAAAAAPGNNRQGDSYRPVKSTWNR